MTTTDRATSTPDSPAPDFPALGEWVPEGSLAAAVLAIGLLEAVRSGVPADAGPMALVTIGIATATLLCRRAPGAALAVVWAVGAIQIFAGIEAVTAEVAVAFVAFGCARWGRPATVAISGISIPVVAGLVVLVVVSGSFGIFQGIGAVSRLIDLSYERGFGNGVVVGLAVLGMLVLALPWFAGLALRATERAKQSEISQVAAEESAVTAQRETSQAHEIARLREDQATLARDVHDVVGHSLAVILAQAESAQYLPDDPAQLKSTLATIATSARGSLQDVRQVLSTTRESQPATRPDGIGELVDGIRASGQEVVVDEIGQPQPLPPELEVAAHRVLQEMLTNAVKHGVRDQPIRVERHWPAGGFEQDLRIEVRNVEQSVAPLDETQPIRTPGQGLDGMRRRVESVGGRFDVRRRTEADGTTFTATAWVPVRG